MLLNYKKILNKHRILGNKLFVNTITAKEITSKLVNGIHPKNIITLSKNQTIPATVKFENLEITERLIVQQFVLLLMFFSTKSCFRWMMIKWSMKICYNSALP